LAGYSGDADGLRSAGSRADGTTAVTDLLALAAATAAGVADDPVTIHEAKAKVGKLVRSPDPTIALKASELFVKLEVAERQRGDAERVLDDAGWEAYMRETLSLSHGVGYCAMLSLAAAENYGPRIDLCSAIPMFRQTAPMMAQQWPELWLKIRGALDDDCRAIVDAAAAAKPVPLMELIPKTETAPVVEDEPNATA
jgi:hypothetical protein